MRKLIIALVAGFGVIATGSACKKASAYVEPPPTEYSTSRFELAVPPAADTVQGAAVSSEFMRVIGMRPLLGRWFIDGDFQSPGGQTAVLSYALWRRRFGTDPTIIGRSIRLNGQATVVVGVLPQDFEFPKGTAVWLPRR